MKKILVVIDMQNDFIDGPLGTPEAVAIVDKVCDKIRENCWYDIYITKDTHPRYGYTDTQEGKKLPIAHCIRGTDGWYLNEKMWMALNKKNFIEFKKESFGCVKIIKEIEELTKGLLGTNPKDIELTLIGVCTDICVISNALLLKAHYPEMKIVVDASCCAGTTPEKHGMALEVMKSCQVDVINEPEPVSEYWKSLNKESYNTIIKESEG